MQFYYVNARYNKKTVLLAGPFFNDVKSAENLIDPAMRMLEATGDVIAPHASYGVIGLNKDCGNGLFNKELHKAGYPNLRLDTQH